MSELRLFEVEEQPPSRTLDGMRLQNRRSPSLERGTSSLFQCSWCGALLELHEPWPRPTGPCPGCHHEPAGWWEQDHWWPEEVDRCTS